MSHRVDSSMIWRAGLRYPSLWSSSLSVVMSVQRQILLLIYFLLIPSQLILRLIFNLLIYFLLICSLLIFSVITLLILLLDSYLIYSLLVWSLDSILLVSSLLVLVWVLSFWVLLFWCPVFWHYDTFQMKLSQTQFLFHSHFCSISLLFFLKFLYPPYLFLPFYISFNWQMNRETSNYCRVKCKLSDVSISKVVNFLWKWIFISSIYKFHATCANEAIKKIEKRKLKRDSQ